MSEPKNRSGTAQAAVVLRPEDRRCQVDFGDRTALVEYGVPFGPRAKTLTPGHLVAVMEMPDEPNPLPPCAPDRLMVLW